MSANPFTSSEALLRTAIGVVHGSHVTAVCHSDLVEDDCACDAAAPVTTELQTGPYHAGQPAYQHNLTPDDLLVLPPASPVGPVVLNTAAQAVWQGFRQPRPLHTPLEQWLARAGLLLPVDCASSVERPAPTGLTAWLHVTDACNLACPYCYVRKSQRRMSLETGQRIIHELFAAAQAGGHSSVKIKFAGGEASLRFALVRALHEEAQRCAERAGLPWRAVVLSNGVALRLLDAQWLAQTGTRLMISLDGVGAAHDRLRATTDGAGSFARIERNVDQLLLPAGVQPSISITVTGRNASAAAGAARWALNRDLPVSLNFYRIPPGQATPGDLALETARVIEGMLAVYRVFEELLPRKPFLHGLLDRFRPEAHAHTCGAGGPYQVFGVDGQRAACHMLLDPHLANHPSAALQNLPALQKTGCAGCAFLHYCTGGCPLEAFRVSGKWDAASPNCAIYRALIPAALRLEGLRLLRLS